MAKRAPPNCIYCSDGAGVTVDHIPPTCFFSTKPKYPITVPCCENCRVKDQGHDELVRNLFSSTRGTETHEDVRGELGEAQKRSYSYQPGKLLNLIELTGPTPYGQAFNFDDVRVDRFLERVARAVLYDAFRQPYFSSNAEWQPLPPESNELFLRPLSNELRRKDIDSVFAYVGAPIDEEGTPFVPLCFYSNLIVAVRFTK